MAFRGAIAMSKGFSIVKIRDKKKKEQKWQNAYRKQKTQSKESELPPLSRTSTLHTDGGVVRFKRTKTTAGIDIQINHSLAKLNSVYEGECLCGRPNCHCTDESSLNSPYLQSSDLEAHRSPSQDWPVDYQFRRSRFNLKLQPQEMGMDESSYQQSIGGTSSQRELVLAYNTRKQVAENEEKITRERIRQARLLQLGQRMKEKETSKGVAAPEITTTGGNEALHTETSTPKSDGKLPT